MSLFSEFHAQIFAEAVEAYPEEAVWLITPGECRRVKNCHEQPTDYFRVSKQSLAAAMARGLLAIVHSHPGGISAPSEADMVGQVSTGVPWGLLSTDGTSATDLVWWGTPECVPPLLGRPFRHGVTDCYALIKDFYLLELGIHLPEFPRNWEWWNTGGPGFSEGFAAAGFSVIDESDARPGDVWLAQIRSEVPNHGGILLDGEVVLHQAGSTRQVDQSKLSGREPLHRYRPLITHWLRHKEVTIQ